MNDWSLRLARPGDASHFPAVEHSAAQAFGEIEGLETLVDGWSIPEERHRLLIAKGHCLTALVDDQIAGFVAAERFGRALHLWEMSVASDFQRHAIGSGLVRACAIDAPFAQVPWNAPFYARLGFERIEDLAAWPRLAQLLEEENESFGKSHERIAMVRFLD